MSTHETEDRSAKLLEELMQKYGHVIRAAVYRVGGPRFGLQADDIMQTVLLEVWKQVVREQDIRSPPSYLYRAAVRATVRLMQQHRGRAEEPLEEATTEPVATGSTADPDRQLRSAEIRQEIQDALEKLIPDRSRAVEDHLAGYRVQEIMKRRDWTYSRARNLIARGMADLRSELERRGIRGD